MYQDLYDRVKYQNLYDRAKKIIKKDICLKFYDTSVPLYLETDTSGVGVGVYYCW